MIPDLKYAVRMLIKTPGFAIIAILAVALGIGASTTSFSIVGALLFTVGLVACYLPGALSHASRSNRGVAS